MTITAAPPGAAPRVGRDGRLVLDVERREGRSIVARAAYALPLQVLAPVALPDPAAVVSILNPTGGLVGGDRLEIDVGVGPGAHACLTTPSATKVYRTAGPAAEQHVRLRAGAGAVLEWVPDHTIPFAGSAFRQTIDVALGDGATLVLVDAFAAGRVAREERWRFARLESRVAVRDGQGPLLHDAFVLDGTGAGAGLGRAEGRPYFASVVVVAPAGVETLARALHAACDVPGVAAGVARLARGGVLVRALADDAPGLLALIDRAWAAARRALGRPPLALRKP